MAINLNRIYLKSPIGALEILAKNGKIIELNSVKNLSKNVDSSSENYAVLQKCKYELELYFMGRLKKFSVQVEINGSNFQKKVYRQLLSIEFGKTKTYKQIAESIGIPNAFRAVGNANAKNKIPIIVPCHRVLAANSIGGYSWLDGIETKKFLLKLEGHSFT